MSTRPSSEADVQPSNSTWPLAALGAIRKRIFPSPSRLELDRNLGVHPSHPFNFCSLTLEQQAAYWPTLMRDEMFGSLRSGDSALGLPGVVVLSGGGGLGGSRGVGSAARRSEKKTRKKTKKSAKLSEASALLRLVACELANEIRNEFGTPNSAFIESQLHERLYKLSAKDLTAMLHERHKFSLSGVKTVTRTPEYRKWKPHRNRGTTGRLDPDSPAVAATSAGGESSSSGATRNAEFVAANGLREHRRSKLPVVDREALQAYNADPESREFARKHPELFDSHANLGD